MGTLSEYVEVMHGLRGILLPSLTVEQAIVSLAYLPQLLHFIWANEFFICVLSSDRAVR